jgi:hypothetical protein
MRVDIETAEQLYGDGMPYEKDRILNQIRFYAEQHVNSLWEMGQLCLRLKAHEGHGGYLDALEKIGISHSAASYAMAAVLKFGSNFHTYGNLSVSKLRILTILDEPNLQEIADGGSYAGMTLDEIDQMSVKELREKLREERTKRKQERDAQEKAIAQKEAKINELDQQLRYQSPPTKEQEAQAELDGMTADYRRALLDAMGYLHVVTNLLSRAECVPGVNVQMLGEWLNSFNDEMVLLNDVRDELIGEIDEPRVFNKGAVRLRGEDDVPDMG